MIYDSYESKGYKKVAENDYQKLYVKEVTTASGHTYKDIKVDAKVGGVVMIVSTVGGYLFIKHPRVYGDSWELPRGFQEAGETPVESAKRELWEEVGIAEQNISSVYDLGFVTSDAGFIRQKVHVVLFEVGSDQAKANDTEEVKKYKWVSRERLAEFLREQHVYDGFTLSALGKLHLDRD